MDFEFRVQGLWLGVQIFRLPLHGLEFGLGGPCLRVQCFRISFGLSASSGVLGSGFRV